VDGDAEDAGRALAALGGARVILATAPSAAAISRLVPGLGLEGCLLIVAAPIEPLQIGAFDLILGTRRVQGWAAGTAADSMDALAFAQRSGVQPMIETFPLLEAQAAVQHMLSGKARFRAVLNVAA
jgi:D-arabinose 1-dehydrogenase-like Zn-dependent alcohol dehydrogenase